MDALFNTKGIGTCNEVLDGIMHVSPQLSGYCPLTVSYPGAVAGCSREVLVSALAFFMTTENNKNKNKLKYIIT